MDSNSLFLQRATAQGPDWHVSYPALAMASSTESIDERRKQIVVGAADDTNLRMVFFSSLGAILDFQAAWTELDSSARAWLAFTTRWNRWWLPDAEALDAIELKAQAPTDVRLAHRTIDGGPTNTSAFRLYLDVVEQHYRRDESIARVLFPRTGELMQPPNAALDVALP